MAALFLNGRCKQHLLERPLPEVYSQLEHLGLGQLLRLLLLQPQLLLPFPLPFFSLLPFLFLVVALQHVWPRFLLLPLLLLLLPLAPLLDVATQEVLVVLVTVLGKFTKTKDGY
jgi:hypothetical protein